MTDYVAKIRAKGLDATGVTEDIAREMHAHKGKHYMGIVEFKVDETHDKADGQHKVDLVLTQVEPAVDTALDEHLRELTRTLHHNRALKSEDQQLTIDTAEDLEPSIEDVIAARKAHDASHPHLFDSDESETEPRCLACGELEGDDLHVPTVDPATSDQPDDDTDIDDQPNPDDPAYEPHTFDGAGPEYSCTICDQPSGAAIHENALVTT